MSTTQNDNFSLPKGGRIMQKRRGRPPKSGNDETGKEQHVIVKHVRFTPLEWEEVEGRMLSKDRGNFSAYARRILTGIRPIVIDSEITGMLRAARKDIVNFINAVSGMKLNVTQRKQLLLSIPTLAEWWPKLEKEILGINRFFDIIHQKGFYSFGKDKEGIV